MDNPTALDFAQLTTSFSAGKVYSSSAAAQVTFKFYRGGALVATETVDRTGLACDTGASGSWAPDGGFDRVVVSGIVIIGLTELEACRN